METEVRGTGRWTGTASKAIVGAVPPNTNARSPKFAVTKGDRNNASGRGRGAHIVTPMPTASSPLGRPSKYRPSLGEQVQTGVGESHASGVHAQSGGTDVGSGHCRLRSGSGRHTNTVSPANCGPPQHRESQQPYSSSANRSAYTELYALGRGGEGSRGSMRRSKVGEARDDVFVRRAALVRALDCLGLPTLLDHHQRPPKEPLPTALLHAQDRKMRLAKQAGITKYSGPLAAAASSSRRSAVVEPSTGRCNDSDVSTAAEGGTGAHWELRFNTAQGQLGVWMGGTHVTMAGVDEVKRSVSGGGEGRWTTSSDRATGSTTRRTENVEGGTTAVTDRHWHPGHIPYLRFSDPPGWIMRPSSWYEPGSDGGEALGGGRKAERVPAGEGGGDCDSDGGEHDDDGDCGGAVAAALRRYRKPACGNLHSGLSSLHFTPPPTANPAR